MKVLVDTSVWIEFFSKKPSPKKDLLKRLLIEEVCICGVVLTEFLQGARSDREYERAIGAFSRLPLLPMQRSTFEFAADIYRSLRKKGVTVRNTIDCLIAAVALEQNAALLHADKDFDSIARHFPLKILA